ncbi:flavodoxin family protein [Methanosphaera sp. WGK6]|uniref:flavodoxin family protein n=1 Tax=Methanosphaera sp. WGK6 TaxID=1561964 RepID=UPI00084BC993|nr:flavodoxin family protein [Methanosphaera sp. WGK6]
MKVVTLMTTYNRNGNTRKIVDRLTTGIKDAEGSNEILYMGDYNIGFCTGCGTCKSGGGCVLDDDYNKLLDKIRQADYFIFSAPIYYGDLAAQSKVFIDRLGSIGNDENLEMKEKKTMIILTHLSSTINDFVIENTHRGIVTANFKVNKILDIGDLLLRTVDKYTEDELEGFEDIGYELEDYEVIPHKLDLENNTL